MGAAFVFIVVEYCTQSHLSTENYDDAAKGLKRTRRFKKYTAWLRDGPDYMIDNAIRLWSHIWRSNARRMSTDKSQAGRYGQGGRRSLLWTWTTKRQRGRRMESGIIEGIPLHQQVSPRESRRRAPSSNSRSPKPSEDTGFRPYMSPVSAEWDYPPELPTQPVEIPLEERTYSYRATYRH